MTNRLDAFKRRNLLSGKENISLIELDEEPPQEMDEDALKTILEVALLCKSTSRQINYNEKNNY